nr:AAA family ATPase [Ruegeria lacuscaerulensis]
MSLSNQGDLRFGQRGSKSVVLHGEKRGSFYDHEAQDGGYLRIPDADFDQLAAQGDRTFRLGNSKMEKPNREKARQLWSKALPIEGTPAQRYLEARGILRHLPENAARFHPNAVDGRPCCVFPVLDSMGEICGVQRVPLSIDGVRVGDRKSLGPIGEGWFEVSDAEPAHTLVAEGAEDALAIWRAMKDDISTPDVRVVAMLGQRWLRAAKDFPCGIFCADADSVAAAQDAAASCGGRVFDPSPRKDANEILIEDGPTQLWNRLRRAPRAQMGSETPERVATDGFWLGEVEPVLENADAIRGWLPKRGIATLYGPPGSGKTWLALDMAAHIAANQPWYSHRTQGGPVVYVAFEGVGGVRNRLVPLLRKVGPVPMYVMNGGLDLCDEDAVSFLLKQIHALSQEAGEAVQTVFIDTLARAIGGRDENSPEGMGAALGGASAIEKAIDGLVLLVHHTGKDTSRGARGHSSLKGAVDAEISITRDGDIITAVAEKVRDGEDGAIFSYQLQQVALGLDRDGEHVTSCFIEPMSNSPHETADAAVQLPDKQQNLIEALSLYIDEHGSWNPGGEEWPEPEMHRIVNQEELIAYASKLGISKASRDRDQKREITRMIDALQTAGRVGTNRDWIWLV